MKLASQKHFFLAASLALVLAGCTKKPTRPDPGATVLGPQGGGGGLGAGAMNQGPMSPISVPTNLEAPGLEVRTDGFDASGQNRSALGAQTVYFDFDQSAIKASERAKLKLAKEYLDKNPTHRLVLEGHCDWRGTAEYNLSLGDRRANSARKYLQTLGVTADRLDTVSKGSLEAGKNSDEATMAKDRRVDLVVVGAGPKPLGGL